MEGKALSAAPIGH